MMTTIGIVVLSILLIATWLLMGVFVYALMGWYQDGFDRNMYEADLLRLRQAAGFAVGCGDILKLRIRANLYFAGGMGLIAAWVYFGIAMVGWVSG